jgi:S-adenosylmethionine:tRNA ribosyltransferase-isomerase
VGASVVRALESSVLVSGTVKANKGWTDRFVFPPSEFKIANMYITNFTPSASPSLLLAAAFLEDNLIPEIMKLAFEKKYRLYAYGDAMLIL